MSGGQHRSKKSPFHRNPKTGRFTYDKAERFRILRAILRSLYLKGRPPNAVQDVLIMECSALIMELHADLEKFGEGKLGKLSGDHLRKLDKLKSTLNDLRPKAPTKSGGNAAQDEGLGLADIISGGGS